jgi:hypothetical protein
VGALQSPLLLHGSLMHVPIEPFVWVQYSPVAQLSTPPSVTRQPVVHVPDAAFDVSQ